MDIKHAKIQIVSPDACTYDNSVESVNFINGYDDESSLRRLSTANEYTMYGIILDILLVQMFIIGEYRMKHKSKQNNLECLA